MSVFNDRTGLSGDYMTVWARRITYIWLGKRRQANKEKYRERLSAPVETYFEYNNEKYPGSIDDMMQRVDETFLDALDELVRRFNQLSIGDRSSLDKNRLYSKQTRQIIKGQIPE